MLIKLFRQAGWVSLGTAVGQGAVLLSTPFLARFYTPAEFGTLALLITISNIALAVGCLRYDLVLPSSPDKDARGLLMLCIAASFLSAVIVALTLGIYGRCLTSGAASAALADNWLVIAVCVCLTSAWQATNAFMLRSSKYTNVGLLRASQGVAFAALAPITSIGLLSAYALSFIGGGMALVQVLSSKKFGRWLGLAKKYKDLPTLSLPGAILDVVGYSFCVWTVLSIYGSAAGGELSQVQRLVGAPLMLVSLGLGQILLRLIADLQDQRAVVRQLLIRLLGILCMMAILVIAVLFFVGKPIVELLLGSQWSISQRFIICISIAVIVRACVSPLSAVLITYRRFGLGLLWQATYFASALILFPTAAKSLTFEQFITFYAAHEAVAYALYLGLIFYSLKD